MRHWRISGPPPGLQRHRPSHLPSQRQRRHPGHRNTSRPMGLVAEVFPNLSSSSHSIHQLRHPCHRHHRRLSSAITRDRPQRRRPVQARHMRGSTILDPPPCMMLCEEHQRHRAANGVRQHQPCTRRAPCPLSEEALLGTSIMSLHPDPSIPDDPRIISSPRRPPTLPHHDFLYQVSTLNRRRCCRHQRQQWRVHVYKPSWNDMGR